VVTWCPTKNLGLIGSAVLTFIGNKQKDRQAKFIYRFSLSVCLFGCLSVSLCPLNVKTAEPIRPKFCMGPHVAPGKVYGPSDFKYVILKYIYFKLFNLVKFWKYASEKILWNTQILFFFFFLIKSAKFFFLCFSMLH